jgi:hypothetical protein
MKYITSFSLFLFLLIVTSCSIIGYPGDRRDYPDDRNERKDRDKDGVERKRAAVTRIAA